MAAQVKILVKGITSADSLAETGEEKSRSTITLVRDNDLVMVVDPGILESQQVLIDALAKENLTVKDINIVCLTHSHLDHFRNIGMFPDAKVLDYWGLWDRGTVDPWPENFTPNIKILHTPGHDYSSISLFVKTAPDSDCPGVVAICGDVFWKKNFPQDPHDDAFASNPERLMDSRVLVLEMADWIIPGHSDIYKNHKLEVPVAESKLQEISREQKIVITCKKCGRPMKQKDKCKCRPYLCYNCCMCDMDCDNCSCSHRKGKKHII